MNPSEVEKFERSYAELQGRLFEFCTRCGVRVPPYSCNDYLDHDEAWNYGEPLLGDPNIAEGETETGARSVKLSGEHSLRTIQPGFADVAI